MKNALGQGFALLAFATICGTAGAADMAVKAPPPPAPPPPPAFTWTGVYFGAQGGGDWGKDSYSFPGPDTSISQSYKTGIFGGQVGFNYQWSWLVVGGEFSSNGLTNDTVSTPCPTPTFTCSTGFNDLLMATGRAGVAWDRLLVYGAAGGAWQSVSSTTSPAFAGFNDNHEFSAPVYGGGLEYAVTNWLTIGGEYLQIQHDTETFAPGTAPGVVHTISGYEHLVLGKINILFISAK